MTGYLLGLCTLPALYVATRLALWLFDSTRSWHECGWCRYKTTTKWDRLKRSQMRLHEGRNHRRVIRAYKAGLAEAKAQGMSGREAHHYADRLVKRH